MVSQLKSLLDSLQFAVNMEASQEKFKCEFCDKTFMRKGYLTQHLMTHNNEAISCEICQKTFSSTAKISPKIE